MLTIVISGLFVGVAFVQLDSVMKQKDGTESDVSTTENPLKGLIAVLITCVTAGFAGQLTIYIIYSLPLSISNWTKF